MERNKLPSVCFATAEEDKVLLSVPGLLVPLSLSVEEAWALAMLLRQESLSAGYFQDFCADRIAWRQDTQSEFKQIKASLKKQHEVLQEEAEFSFEEEA